MTRTLFTPAQAADHIGCGRTSIMRALSNKQLLGERDNRNRWKISLEALEEWAKNRPDSDRPQEDSDPVTVQDMTGQLREELAEARTEAKMLREQLEELKKDRDAWRNRSEKLDDRLAELSKPQTGLFARIFGR